MSKKKRPQPREITLPHHSYQPCRAELHEDHRVDATLDEVVVAFCPALMKQLRDTKTSIRPKKP